MTASAADVALVALDGTPLRATLYEGAAARQAVILGGATAVPRGYYRAFAEHLAARGAAVLTYDYRGSGEAPGVLRRSTARMRDWGTSDFGGAIAYMRQRFAGLPLHVVGHSHGGHALLLAPNGDAIERAVTVASQLGYWKLCAAPERYRVWLLLNVLAPAMVRATGYVPGSRLGLGEDLAPGIMDEWRRWCSSPGYFYDDPTMARALERGSVFRAPTLMIGLADDTWATPRAIDALAARFPSAARLTVDPRERGLPPVGHFGFFRSRNGPALWPLVADHLGLMGAVA